MKQLAIGVLLGWSLHFLVAAASPGERELERMRGELEESNRNLEAIARSLDKIDDAFGYSHLNVKTDK